jgi:aldehyde:ferredoxin oxidoreductase
MTPYEFEHIPTIWQENLNAVQDSLNNCRFAASYYWGLELDYFANILSVGTGLDFSGGDLIKIGERIYNVERAFSCREGLTRKDDTLPKRIFEEPIPDTPEGVVVDEGKFEKLKTLYYETRGWDVETGIPGRQKLEELGLKYIADELEGVKGKTKK